MLEIIRFIISGFGSCLRLILGIQIPFGEDSYIYFYDVIVFIFILFVFIKLFAIVTHNHTISRKE